IDLAEGSGEIHGLTIGNPQGFATAQAFSLGEIATQLDLKSLSAEVTVIEHIIVRAPEVFFEMNSAGKNNLDQLKQKLTSKSSGTSKAAADNENGTAPRLIIRKLLFEGGNIHARVIPLGKNYDLKLPEIEMQNLGGKNGATPEQIAEQVVKKLTDRALAEIKKKGLDQYREKFEGEVNKRLGAEKEKLDEKVGEKLKGVFGY
ncbi:MAG TPA: hypothetical protein VJ969_08310, partial [Desulfopila sp.]|nr:hypothetical protein [Desulfopila sp.]